LTRVVTQRVRRCRSRNGSRVILSTSILEFLRRENGDRMIRGRSDEKLAEVCSIVSSFKTAGRGSRSEEHTSELQSRFDLVCRLLLEKKNIHYFLYHSSRYLLFFFYCTLCDPPDVLSFLHDALPISRGMVRASSSRPRSSSSSVARMVIA